jgi:hypothetical protein
MLPKHREPVATATGDSECGSTARRASSRVDGEGVEPKTAGEIVGEDASRRQAADGAPVRTKEPIMSMGTFKVPSKEDPTFTAAGAY